MTGYIHPLAAPFSLEGERPDAVLLLHGWTGSPAHLRLLGGELNQAGFAVHAPLLAGHGTALEDMAETGWRDWMRSAVEGSFLVGDKRLHLVGLSMGGLMALLMAPVLDAATVTTINAPQKVWDRRRRYARAFRGSARIEVGEAPIPVPAEVRDYQQQYDGNKYNIIPVLIHEFVEFIHVERYGYNQALVFKTITFVNRNSEPLLIWPFLFSFYLFKVH